MFLIRPIPLLLLLLIPLSNCAPPQSETRFNLSVVHVNDFHARFEESSTSGGICKDGEKCIGGFSRLYKQIKNMLEVRPDSVLLNVGDNFQGTLWYTIGKWNITQEFLNKLPFDATVLGNHEFEDKIEGLIPFMKALRSPIVVANVDDSLEPTFQGLYNKSTVIERNGKRIGIIGVLVSTVKQTADTGNLNFYLESPSVNAEAERLVKEEGVFTNIVLSHAGYDVDQAIAANASEKISLIVGGHTHTFLYTGDNPPGPENVEGPYPTIVKSKNGKNVLVVQASSFCRYLGNITIFLDDFGEIVDYSGAPIFLDSSLPQDEQINENLLPWKQMVDAEGGAIVGSSLVTLDISKCKYAECTFGNLIADAMVYSWTDKAEKGSWTYASIAAVAPRGIKTNIAIGNITYNDLIIAVPYKNTYDVVEIEGKYIKELLEYNALPYFDKATDTSLKLMQFSGIHVVLNLTRPLGERVQSLKIRCQACDIPLYENLDANKTYRMVITSYLSNGGDGYTVLTENMKNLQVGQIDTDVLVDYINQRSPVFQEEEERIVIFR
ncbi:apyrase [Anoplophora glabripennis]|uniref:apyrase n=1 Tax=Anoplophora glabripennis TaxID=217634 RepID=UPI000873CADA|nr:apyrase [Anoplophora glabripennis]